MEQYIIYLAIALFVFAVIRELFCWYFKINKQVYLQEQSVKNQEKIIALLTPPIIENDVPYVDRFEV